MKSIKAIFLVLLTISLTGCYTQLQYSNTMKRITEERSPDRSAPHDRAEQQEQVASRKAEQTEREQKYYGETEPQGEYVESEGYDEEYYPVTYKDYETLNRWEECACNPYVYNNYNFYGSGAYFPASYYSYGSPYSAGIGFGPRHNYFASGSPVVFYTRFSWGNPLWPQFHHHWGHHYVYGGHFWDHPFYNPFYYGHHTFATTNFIFSSGHSGSAIINNATDRNVRNGRRSIGSNRVGTVHSRTDNGRSRNSTAKRVNNRLARPDYERAQQYLKKQKVHFKRKRNSRKRSSFFGSINNLFRESLNNSNKSGNVIRFRKSSNSSGNSSTSVRRSRSSSDSKGSSSRSRKRSSSSNNDDNKRSRGNN